MLDHGFHDGLVAFRRTLACQRVNLALPSQAHTLQPLMQRLDFNRLSPRQN